VRKEEDGTDWQSCAVAPFGIGWFYYQRCNYFLRSDENFIQLRVCFCEGLVILKHMRSACMCVARSFVLLKHLFNKRVIIGLDSGNSSSYPNLKQPFLS
jgi:hypothetical protein